MTVMCIICDNHVEGGKNTGEEREGRYCSIDYRMRERDRERENLKVLGCWGWGEM